MPRTLSEINSLPERIRQLIQDWDIHPIVINSGLCADFATVLWERDPSLNIISDNDLDGREYSHTFIEFEGRYYDAETPDGVDDWRKLPIFERREEWNKWVKVYYPVVC